jgi:hypothetical protein
VNELEDRLTALLHERAAQVLVVDDLDGIRDELSAGAEPPGRRLVAVRPECTSPQHRSPRTLSLVAASVLAVAGVGLTAVARQAPRFHGSASEPASPPTSSAPDLASTLAADTLQVRCDGDTTTILTPTVQARPDGVHALVTNLSDGPLAIEWDSGGDGARRGDSRHLLPLPPGGARFRCTSDNDAAGSGPSRWATFTVVEPPGWVSPELDCSTQGTGIIDYAPGAGAAIGVDDPLGAAIDYAHAVATADDVQVVPAGYATSEQRSFVVLEDGVPTISLTYTTDGNGGWLLTSSTTCS